MPEFLDDVDRYLRELSQHHAHPNLIRPVHFAPSVITTNVYQTPSASSSPLLPDKLMVVQRAELAHEVQTQGTIHREFVDAPLSRSHPRYNETCFECHCLGH